MSTGQSLAIEASSTFSSCVCDLTLNACDEACCCDTDCAETTREEWRKMKDYCKDEINQQTILTAD